MSRRSRTSDEIDVISSSDDGDARVPLARAPITIRGVGHITMFGLNSRFDTEFPGELTGRVAPEELSATLSRINGVLKRHSVVDVRAIVLLLQSRLFFVARCLLKSKSKFFIISVSTVNAVEKCLDHENVTLYHKLGLHWRLARRPVDSNQRLTEYVLELEILPKAPLLSPD